MNTARRAFLGVAAWTGGITALHGYLNVNWTAVRNSLRSRAELETLIVAGLPVTCNLTLPIACVARNLDKTSTRANFEN
jgi:NitT/TauT family transport system substrate-binding protein